MIKNRSVERFLFCTAKVDYSLLFQLEIFSLFTVLINDKLFEFQ